MVTLHFLSVLRTVTYRASIALFALVLLFIFAAFLVTAASRLTGRIRSLSKRKIRDTLYRLMFSDLPIEKVSIGRLRRVLALDVFSSILAIIRGGMRDRVKDAVNRLGLVSEIERNVFNLSPAKRLRACQRLGLIGSRSSTELLRHAMRDPNPRVSAAAVIALGELREMQSVPRLLEFFEHCSPSHAWLIAAILPFFGKGIYQYIKSYLAPGALTAPKLILLLKVAAEIRAPESLDDLSLLYGKYEDLDIRINALRAIGNTNDLRAVKIVIAALKCEEWQLRAVAARIVGKMSAGGAACRLIPLLKDPNWHVRRNASEALTNLGKTGMNVLLASLDIDNQSARDIVVHTLEEKGIVAEAVLAVDGSDEKRGKEALLLLKVLLRKGYTRYLENFRNVCPAVERIMSELSHA